MTLATVLRKRRLELGYSQAEIADFLGVSTGLISRVENLDSSLHLAYWNRLGGILKIKASKLYICIDGDFFSRQRIHLEDEIF